MKNEKFSKNSENSRHFLKIVQKILENSRKFFENSQKILRKFLENFILESNKNSQKILKFLEIPENLENCQKILGNFWTFLEKFSENSWKIVLILKVKNSRKFWKILENFQKILEKLLELFDSKMKNSRKFWKIL